VSRDPTLDRERAPLLRDHVVRAAADDGAIVEVVLPAGSIGTAGRDALAELAARWPPRGLRPLRPAGADPRVDSVAAVRETRIELSMRADENAWDRLESGLGLFTAERLADRVAVHAALVVVGGMGIVLPGRSHSGKSTLAVALTATSCTSGWPLAVDRPVLASDEYVLIDPATGLVDGWQRAARLRGDGRSPRSRHPVTIVRDPVPVGMVALLRFDPEHGTSVLRVTEIGRSEAVIALLDETVCARSRPDAAMTAALALTATPDVILLRGTRGEAVQAAPDLLGLLVGRDRSDAAQRDPAP
jgi:hypothetical protein